MCKNKDFKLAGECSNFAQGVQTQGTVIGKKVYINANLSLPEIYIIINVP